MDWVVVVTSDNVSAMGNAENLLVIYGNEDLYRVFESYWDDVLEPRGEPQERDAITVGVGDVAVFTFPRADSDDPVVEQLELIREDMVDAPVVHVAQAQFERTADWGHGTRGPCEALADLAVDAFMRFGRAAVEDNFRVVLDNHSRNEHNARQFADALTDAGYDGVIPIVWLPAGRGAGVGASEPDFSADVHHKVLLVDYRRVEGATRTKRVYCGSYNWSEGAHAEGDEILLRVQHPTIYDRYKEELDTLFAIGVPYAEGPTA